MHVAGTQIVINPLVADYIKEDSRGKAIAVQTLGALIGELFQDVVLFGIGMSEELT